MLDERQYAWIRQRIDVSQWRRREISRLQPGEQEEPELLEVVFQQPEHSLWNDEKFKTLVTALAQELEEGSLTEIAVAVTAIILEPSPTQGASLATIHSISRVVENLQTASAGRDAILSCARDFVIAWAAGYCHPELTIESPRWERALLCIGDCLVMRIREVDEWLQENVGGWEPLSNDELWVYANFIALQFVSGKCEEGRSSHPKTCDKSHRLSAWDPTKRSLLTAIYVAVSGEAVRKGSKSIGRSRRKQVAPQPKAFAQSMLFYELKRDDERRLRCGPVEVHDSESGTVSVKKNWFFIDGDSSNYVPIPRRYCEACDNYYNEKLKTCPDCGRRLSQRLTQVQILREIAGANPSVASSGGDETVEQKELNEIQTEYEHEICAGTVEGMHAFVAQLDDSQKVLALFLAREDTDLPKDQRWQVLCDGRDDLHEDELFCLAERLRSAVEEPPNVLQETLTSAEIARQLGAHQEEIAQMLHIPRLVFPAHTGWVSKMLKALWEEAKTAINPAVMQRREKIDELHKERAVLQGHLDRDRRDVLIAYQEILEEEEESDDE